MALQTETPTWFVATKLRPPLLRSDTIRRPHLEEALVRSVATLPLTLLSAPAGYGKTTMLAALPHLQPDLPQAWVTLDSDDNDPIRFAGLLATALQQLHPAVGHSCWPWLTSGGAESASLKRAIGALINDVTTHLTDPFVLVLDDLHFVTEPAAYVALEYLLDHQPPQMHLAVGTRHDPPLRLARLAARRQLTELRRPDLSFSEAETRRLLNETLALGLADGEVAALQSRTEGWPAGLCLLAGPLSRMADRTQWMAALAHSERQALDFLLDEVLLSLPAELRTFLLRTSVLLELTPAACRAVTLRDDAAEVLERLYRQNLAIASLQAGPSGEPVYRYHALFARLLTRQLERELAGEVVDLHRRAAQVQTIPGRAIYHYLAAGLWEEAAQQMAQSGMDLLHRGMSETIRQWHAALPVQTRASHPRLTVLMARCEIQAGNYEAAGQLLGQAREACATAGDLRGELEAITSQITLTIQQDDRPGAAALVARAEALPMPMMGPGLVSLRLAQAWLHLCDRQWAECLQAMRAGLELPRLEANRLAAFLGITYMSAPLLAVPGGLAVGERFCLDAEALALPGSALQLGALELGTWPLLLRGRLDEALARAEAAEALRQRLGGWPVLGSDTALLLSVLHLARGEREAAERATESLLHRVERAPLSRRAFYLHGAGRAMALLGHRARAREILERLAGLRGGQPLADYACHHLEGLLLLSGPRPAEAREALERAARLEAELPVARICGSSRLLLARLEPGPAAAASALLAAWELEGAPGYGLLNGPAPQPIPQPITHQTASGCDPLTPRESDVLRLIVAGRTNRQIGEELYITEETVKTHVVRILRKLDVTSRTQAAVRGRELGF